MYSDSSMGVEKEMLLEQYREFKEVAEDAVEDDDLTRGVKYYLKAGDVLERVSEVEESSELSRKQSRLARKMKRYAVKLKNGDCEEIDNGELDMGEDEVLDREEPPPEIQGTGSTQFDSGQKFVNGVPDKDFDDLVGATELKTRFREKIILPLENPDLYQQFELGVANGFLLHGPPGTGKTHAIECLAGELNYSYLSADAAVLTSKYMGESASITKELFELAVDKQPSLMFVDEIDSIAPSRDNVDVQGQGYIQTVNQFLEGLNQIQGEDVVFAGATNRLDSVDEAVKGTHRIQEVIEVPHPGREDREALLHYFFKERPVSDELDFERWAKQTDGFTVGDIEHFCDEASRQAVQDALGGSRRKSVVSTENMETAFNQIGQ